MNIEKVKKIGKELQASFLDCCQNRSNYSLTVLNINDHATPQRQFKQCVDELVRKVSAIGRMEIDIEELKDKLEQSKEKEANSEGFEQRTASRERRKLDIDLWESNLALEGQLREFNCLHSIYEGMNKYSAEEIQQAEEEYHIKMKTASAQRQLETTGVIDPELIRVLSDMQIIDREHSDRFLTFLKQQKELTNEPNNDLLQVPPV